MTKGSVKRGLPSRFTEGEIARQLVDGVLPDKKHLGLVVLTYRGHNHYRQPRWFVQYLLERALGWTSGHHVKESDLIKTVWTFTGFVDKPGESR